MKKGGWRTWYPLPPRKLMEKFMIAWFRRTPAFFRK